MYMRNSLIICLALSILLWSGCKSEDQKPAAPAKPDVKPVTTQPATTQPVVVQMGHPLVSGAVLSFRILADKIEDDATEFESLRMAVTKEGKMSIPNWPAYRWFVIKNPAAFFRNDKIEVEFPGVRTETSMVVERVNGKCYVLAHVDKDFVMTHEPGGEPWVVGQAWINQETAGDFSVIVNLDDHGAKQLTALTQTRQGKVLGILINDEVVVPATIGEALGSMMKIAGSFTKPDAEALVAQLRQGATMFPQPPQ